MSLLQLCQKVNYNSITERLVLESNSAANNAVGRERPALGRDEIRPTLTNSIFVDRAINQVGPKLVNGARNGGGEDRVIRISQIVAFAIPPIRPSA